MESTKLTEDTSVGDHVRQQSSVQQLGQPSVRHPAEAQDWRL